EDGIRDDLVTGVQTCALPIYSLERVKYPLIPQKDIIAVQDQSRAIDRICTLERKMSMPSTGICPEPVTEVTVPQLKRLRLITIRSEERRVGKECSTRWYSRE